MSDGPWRPMHDQRVPPEQLVAGSKWWPMIFAAFIFVLPASAPQRLSATLMWKLDWLGVGVFLAVFAAAIEAVGERRPMLRIVAATAALGLAFAPFNYPGGTVLIAYACAFAPWATSGDTRRTAFIVAIILVALTAEVLLVSLPARFLLTTAVWGVVAGASYLWVVKVMLSMDRLAKTAERERIARDLHDVLGHTLSLITLKSELAGQLLTQDADIARARQEISAVEAISRKALAEVRQAIRGMRVESLPLEIERVVGTLRTAGISVKCEQESILLDASRTSAVGLALREAITNVVRHAQARTCHIRLRRVNDTCVLEVEDDGQGGTHAQGEGLRGMRERIEGIGGSLLLEHTGGTRVTARVPITS